MHDSEYHERYTSCYSVSSILPLATTLLTVTDCRNLEKHKARGECNMVGWQPEEMAKECLYHKLVHLE